MYVTGRSSDTSLSETIQSSSQAIDKIISDLPREITGHSDGLQLQDEVHSALQALLAVFANSTDEIQKPATDRHFVQSGYSSRNRTVPKVVYSLSSGISTCSRDARWVWFSQVYNDIWHNCKIVINILFALIQVYHCLPANFVLPVDFFIGF